MNLPESGRAPPKRRESAGRGRILWKPLPLARFVVRDALARTLVAIGWSALEQAVYTRRRVYYSLSRRSLSGRRNYLVRWSCRRRMQAGEL